MGKCPFCHTEHEEVNELWHILWAIFRLGFKVGVVSLIGMLATHGIGWETGKQFCQIAFCVGFFPMFAAGVVLMVMHHFGWRPK